MIVGVGPRLGVVRENPPSQVAVRAADPAVVLVEERQLEPETRLGVLAVGLRLAQVVVCPENLKLFIDLTFFEFLIMLLDQRSSSSSDTPW
jgi:hypothetical protein